MTKTNVLNRGKSVLTLFGTAKGETRQLQLEPENNHLDLADPWVKDALSMPFAKARINSGIIVVGQDIHKLGGLQKTVEEQKSELEKLKAELKEKNKENPGKTGLNKIIADQEREIESLKMKLDPKPKPKDPKPKDPNPK